MFITFGVSSTDTLFLLLKSIRITFVFNNKFMFLVVNRLQISAGPQGDQGSRLAIPRMGRVCGLYGSPNPWHALSCPCAHWVLTFTIISTGLSDLKKIGSLSRPDQICCENNRERNFAPFSCWIVIVNNASYICNHFYFFFLSIIKVKVKISIQKFLQALRVYHLRPLNLTKPILFYKIKQLWNCLLVFFKAFSMEFLVLIL